MAACERCNKFTLAPPLARGLGVTSVVNTARLRRIVGWVKRSETQQIPSNSWVEVTKPNLPYLRLRAYLSSIASVVLKQLSGYLLHLWFFQKTWAIISDRSCLHLPQHLPNYIGWHLVSYRYCTNLGWQNKSHLTIFDLLIRLQGINNCVNIQFFG